MEGLGSRKKGQYCQDISSFMNALSFTAPAVDASVRSFVPVPCTSQMPIAALLSRPHLLGASELLRN